MAGFSVGSHQHIAITIDLDPPHEEDKAVLEIFGKAKIGQPFIQALINFLQANKGAISTASENVTPGPSVWP